jgi:hypothetical protein
MERMIPDKNKTKQNKNQNWTKEALVKDQRFDSSGTDEDRRDMNSESLLSITRSTTPYPSPIQGSYK